MKPMSRNNSVGFRFPLRAQCLLFLSAANTVGYGINAQRDRNRKGNMQENTRKEEEIL